MSDVTKQTVEALKQFTKDLEAGDLSGYRITKWVACPVCNDDVCHELCKECQGHGAIRIVVQDGQEPIA